MFNQKTYQLMGKKLLMCAAGILLSIGFAFAQSNVKGHVVSAEDGSPVAGASVMVEGTTMGVYADIEGNFTLNNVPNNAKYIIVGFIGMKDVRAEIAPHMEITLFPDENTLDETIVVAYGTQSRKSITGSVSQIDEEKNSSRVGTSVTGALEGAAPGIQVNNTYGEPGSSPSIRIRGFGSINGSNNPLYVVDGVIFDGNISEINSADIASISVLKDAASAALYGSKATNGVIIITTKSGSGSQKPQISLKINQGLYTRGIPEYSAANPDEWMEISWQAMKNFAKTSALGLDEAAARAYANEHLISDYAKLNIYNKDNNALFDANGKLTATVNPNFTDLNWYDVVQRVGHRQEYNISGSVASSKFNVYASAGYLNEQGYVLASDYERFTARLNTNFTPNKWFKAGINLNATVSDRDYNANANGSYYANPFNTIRMMAPIYPYYLHDHADGEKIVVDGNGDYVWDTKSDYLTNRNIAYELRKDSNKAHRNVLGGQVYGTIMFPYGISFTVKGDLNHSNTSRKAYNNPEIGDGATNNGRLTNYSYRYMNYTVQELLNWDYNFGKHHIDVLLGHENYASDSYYDYAMNTGMAIPGILVMSNFLTNSYTNGYNDYDRAEAYITRARYNYDERYFVDASFRRDGSSRFSPAKRWGNFYSIGFNWNIAREKFMQDVSWVDDLRLRAAFGEVGNNAGVDLYAYQALYEVDKNGGETALLKQSLDASDIKWETTRTFDVGVEGSLFNNRLNFMLGWFDKQSVDLLFSVQLPLSAGSWSHGDSYNMSKYQNIGSVSNSGIELSLSGDLVRTKNFSWSLGAEATFLKNKIKSLPNDNAEMANGTIRRLAVGKSVYEFYTYHFEGVDQMTGRSLYTLDPEQKENAEREKELVTINGKDYTTDTSFGLRDWAGTALPTVYGSFNTGIRWRNFTLSALFTWSLGGKMYDGTYQSLMSTNSASSASANHIDLQNSWADIPSGMTETSANRIDPNGLPSIDFNRSSKSNATSDRWLTSNNYFVIKNVNIGYNLPQRWMKACHLESASINASVENLLSLSARTGMNPQYSFNGGYDNTYVTARVFNLGVTINF